MGVKNSDRAVPGAKSSLWKQELEVHVDGTQAHFQKPWRLNDPLFIFISKQNKPTAHRSFTARPLHRKKNAEQSRNVAVFFFFPTGEYADPNLVTLAQHSNTSDQWLQLRRIFLLCAF